MNMVEKVAKAIYEKRNGKGCTPWAKRGMAHKVAYFSDARAAIEAMKEPTKEMVEAGYSAIHEAVDYYNYDSDSGYTVEPSGGADVLRAMITAALSEESTS